MEKYGVIQVLPSVEDTFIAYEIDNNGKSIRMEIYNLENNGKKPIHHEGDEERIKTQVDKMRDTKRTGRELTDWLMKRR